MNDGEITQFGSIILIEQSTIEDEILFVLHAGGSVGWTLFIWIKFSSANLLFMTKLIPQ